MSLYVDKFELDNQEILIRDTEANNFKNRLENDKTIIISDSYGDGYSPDGATTPFPELMISNGLNAVSLHHGGVGFCSTTDNLNFYLLLKNYTDTLTTAQKEEITKILVCGGINDNDFTQQEIEGAMNTFYTYVNSNYPNAKIYLAMVSYCDYRYAQDVFTKVLTAYQNHYNFNYITNSEFILSNSGLLASDKIHPNQEGQRVLAKKLMSGLTCGSIDNTFLQDNALNITKIDYDIADLDNTSKMVYYSNGLVNTNLRNFRIVLSSPLQITFAGTTIAAWDCPFFERLQKNVVFDCDLVLRDPSNNQFFGAKGCLIFDYDHKVKVAIKSGNGSGFYEPTTNVLRIDYIDTKPLTYPYI